MNRVHLLLLENNPTPTHGLPLRAVEDKSWDCKVTAVSELRVALDHLDRGGIDAVLIDLELADCDALTAVSNLSGLHRNVPILILSDGRNENQVRLCIDQGAEDSLARDEIGSEGIRRAVCNAIGRRRRQRRQREFHSNEVLQRMFEQRSLFSELGSGIDEVKIRTPDVFEFMLHDYRRLLTHYVESCLRLRNKPRLAMEALMTQLGDSGARPRDLVDLHVQAMSDERNQEPGLGLVEDGERLFMLELMGLLVEYYRSEVRPAEFI